MININKRRILIGSLATSIVSIAHAADPLQQLFSGFGAALKAAQQQGAQGTTNASSNIFASKTKRPVFEENIPLSVYQKAYDARFPNTGGVAVESPIQGLGLIKTREGVMPLFINSDISVFYEKGWYELSDNGGRQMSTDEQRLLEIDVWKRIRWDRLVGPVWGKGSPTKAIVFSAVDCPACLAMEHELILNRKKVGVELYYLPTTLNKSLTTKTDILCADQREVAWLNASSRRPIARRQPCAASYENYALEGMMLPARVRSTPTLFFDDGSRGNWAVMKSKILTQS